MQELARTCKMVLAGKFQVFMDVLSEFMYLEDLVKLVHSQYEANQAKEIKVKV